MHVPAAPVSTAEACATTIRCFSPQLHYSSCIDRAANLSLYVHTSVTTWSGVHPTTFHSAKEDKTLFEETADNTRDLVVYVRQAGLLARNFHIHISLH